MQPWQWFQSMQQSASESAAHCLPGSVQGNALLGLQAVPLSSLELLADCTTLQSPRLVRFQGVCTGLTAVSMRALARSFHCQACQLVSALNMGMPAPECCLDPQLVEDLSLRCEVPVSLGAEGPKGLSMPCIPSASQAGVVSQVHGQTHGGALACMQAGLLRMFQPCVSSCAAP